MDSAAVDRAIADHAVGFLLRYFGSAAPVGIDAPSILLERDRELLRLHWALSPAVSALVCHVLQQRHEIQSVLATTKRLEDGIVRGRLDAVATIRHRRLTGHTSAVVSHEPLRSSLSGPNQVLGWVISQAWSLATRFSALTVDSPSYRSVVDHSLQRLEQVRRIQAIQQIAGQMSLTRRPGANALTEAERSRRILYRKAAQAYRFLLAIEAGEPRAIVAMLRETLLAPLEAWRRYELMVGYSLAEALALAEGSKMMLNFFVGATHTPLARAGRYAVFWQWGPQYTAPEPEPSERVINNFLEAYGIRSSADRPDLVVVDMAAASVVAIVEVKYLTAEDASDRIRSAAAQIVRYGRGFRSLPEIDSLLGASLIAVSQGIERITDPAALPLDVPYIVDFSGIREGQLERWVHRFQHHAQPVPPVFQARDA